MSRIEGCPKQSATITGRAMKEDILEQMVDEYLQHKGYFTRHNLKFRPSKDHVEHNTRADAVHSDIDVVGFHPLLRGPRRVIAVSCKSWQQGFNPQYWCDAIKQDKNVAGRKAWRGFRELTSPKWAEAFRTEIQRVTGATAFTYITAVTRLTANANRTCWEQNSMFRKNLAGNTIRLLTFEEMLNEIFGDINQTVASSQLGRMLQLIKASGWAVTPTPAAEEDNAIG